jgi:serine protease Do
MKYKFTIYLAVFWKKDKKEKEQNMKKTSKIIWLSVILILAISFGAFRLVQGQETVSQTDVAAAKLSLSSLYDQINPSVVFVSVAIPAKTTSLDQGQDNPWDNFDFQNIIPFFEQYNQQERPNKKQPEPDNNNEKPMQYGSGTGFVYDTEGHIVTNNHVIEDAAEVTVTYYDGIVRDAEVIGADPDSDLAVLKVTDARTDIQPVTLGDSSKVKTGDFVAAIGNPFGNTGTMTQGIVSALGRSFSLESGSDETGHYSIPDMIQTDAAINPGNSGGVLINLNGEVIGVVNSFSSSTYSSAGIGYAIPSNLAIRVIPKLISDGSYQHAWIGMSGIALTPEINEALELDHDQRGALIQTVQKDSPAEAAGIQGGKETIEISGSEIYSDGDIVTKINDRVVKGMDDVISYLASNTSVGDKITLHILRDGKEIDVDVTLAARPSSEEQEQNAEVIAQNGKGNAWIGTYVKDITAEDIKSLNLPKGTEGALISQVTKDSPADDAELQVNDIIQKMDDQEIHNVDELKEELAKYLPGERITLTILRDNETIEVRLTLGTTVTR